MKYRYQPFRFSNGERAGLIVNSDTGLPLMYQNLYITIHHRNSSESINSIQSALGHLGFFAVLCDYLKIDIEHRFQCGRLLDSSEIESIALWCTKSKKDLIEATEAARSKKVLPIKTTRLEFARVAVVIDDQLVKLGTTYNRLTIIAYYLNWLAGTISVAPEQDIIKMKNRIISHRPIRFMDGSDTE